MTSVRTFLSLALALTLLVACDDDDGGDPDAGTVDAGPGGTDAGTVSCDFPDPIVGGTTETDALADAPARCGQDAHTWLRGNELGQVISVDTPTQYTATLLSGLITAADVTLPREPELDVVVRDMRYQTQDRGQLVESTAVIAYPENADPGTQYDIVLFLHGTSGFTAGCGVTEDMELQLFAGLFASWGYIVVAPDYLGLETGEATYPDLHPYLVGQATAIASIDAARAVARLDPAERGATCARPRVVTFGGSQGGHAGLWVDRLMPYYSRELEHLGLVATVPPADMRAQIERAFTGLFEASGNTAAFYGTAPYWYGYGDRIDEIFASPYDVNVPAALMAECSPDLLDGVTMLDEVYTANVLSAAGTPAFDMLDPWVCMLDENGLTSTSVARLGGEPSTYGILIITGENDDLVNTPIEREAFRTLCNEGLPIEYLECQGASHGGATFDALPEIVRFMDARARGRAVQRGGVL